MAIRRHSRLIQQLESCFGSSKAFPPEWQSFLDLVDEAYQNADVDRLLSNPSLVGPTIEMPAVPPTTSESGSEPDGPSAEMAFLDTLPDLVFRFDPSGKILDCRAGDSMDLARPRRQLIGRNVTRCPFGTIGQQFRDAIAETAIRRKPVSIEYRMPCDNGLAFFEARVTRSGQDIVALVRNKTRHADAEADLRRGSQEHRAMMESAHIPILIIDPMNGQVVHCNRYARAFYKLGSADLDELTLESLFVEPSNVPNLKDLLHRNRTEYLEVQHKTSDGTVVRVEMRLSAAQYGGRSMLLCVSREVEGHAAGGSELRQSLSLLEATFDATADGILVVDGDRKVVTFNRLFAEMWKLPPEALARGNEKVAIRLALDQIKDEEAFQKGMLAIHESNHGKSWDVVEFKDGRFFECVSMPQVIGGRPAGRVWSFRDITDRMQSEEKIRFHAFHDSLTGLPNRTLFHDRLAQGLGQSRRAQHTTALLLIDLDRFKTINDTLGHDAGDQLLVEVAKRLETRRRDGDTIARLGGDEFVFFITQLRNREDIAVVAEQVLDVLKPSILIDEHDLHISASIGIAVFPDDGADGAALMKSADVALYRAKELGRNNYQIYEPKLSERAMDRLVMEKDLRRAIHNKEFVVQYQPQYDLNSGRLTGVEALIRWQRGEVLVPPDKFIPIAEECGLVVPLGRWVLREAARQCVIFNELRSDPLRLCVNLSALQIQRPNFANEVSQSMHEAGFPLTSLVLELTESALMHNPDLGSWAMAQLQEMGVGIALDDFGTGHSSLSHVSHLPISMIKIDKAFVRDCASRATDEAIISAIITMGHALKLKVLAEGVENEEQAEVLKRHGCNEVQGYFYSRPIPADELIGLIKAEAAAPVAKKTTSAKSA